MNRSFWSTIHLAFAELLGLISTSYPRNVQRNCGVLLPSGAHCNEIPVDEWTLCEAHVCEMLASDDVL